MPYGYPTEEDDDQFQRDQEEESQREDEKRQEALQQTQPDADAAALEPQTNQGGVVDEQNLPPGLIPLRQKPSFDPNRDLPEGLQPLPGQEPKQELQPSGVQHQSVTGLPEGLTASPGQEELLKQMPQQGQGQNVPFYGDALYPNIASQRAPLIAELERNPRLLEYAAAAVSQEGHGGDTIQAIVESLFNRTSQRNSSILKELFNGFYGPINRGDVDRFIKNNGGRTPDWAMAQFHTALDAVRNGSDLIQGRTDQGMRGEIHGPATKYGSEWFGYMDGDPTWSLQHQRNKGDGTNVGYAQPSSYQQQGGGGRGIDSAIAEAEQAGLTVTSGYRSPDDPLSRANPKSAHTQGRAFDLRAKTGADADAVMAKQREIFRNRGMEEGRDYKFIDEVRHPSGHATGPHVHVQMTDSGIMNYGGNQGGTQFLPLRGPQQADPSANLPEGLYPSAPTGELPEGLQPTTGHQELPEGLTPVGPETGTQQLPSGAVAPLEGQAARQGREEEEAMKAPERGNIDLSHRPIVKNADGSVSTVRSMSFNEDGKEVLIPTVVNGKVVSDKEAIAHYKNTGQHLGKFNTVKEADAYAEVLHKAEEERVKPYIPTPEQKEIDTKRKGLQKEYYKLQETFVAGDLETQAKMEKLDQQIKAEDKKYDKIEATKTPPKTMAETAVSNVNYIKSLAATGAQAIDQALMSKGKGISESSAMRAAAIETTLTNPYKTPAEAKEARPQLERWLKTYDESIAELNKHYDPSNPSQVKVMDAYTKQQTDLQRKIAFAKAMEKGEKGEGIGKEAAAYMHTENLKKAEKIRDVYMPEHDKFFNQYIDQDKKDDAAHNIVRSTAGSIPDTAIMAVLSPLGVAPAAVAGFMGMYYQTYSDKSDEILRYWKENGIKDDPVKRDQAAHLAAITQVPMEEVGDILGMKAFTRALRMLPKGLSAKELGKFIKENPNWIEKGVKKVAGKAKEAAKEIGPTIIAEGAITNPIQSVEDDLLNEKLGIQAPTTLLEKVKKAGLAGAEGAISATLLWGGPTAVVAARRAFQRKAEGTAMPGGEVKFTPREPSEVEKAHARLAEIDSAVTALTEDKSKTEQNAPQVAKLMTEAMDLTKKIEEAPPEPTPTAPVEPTRDVVERKSRTVTNAVGKKGKVTEEKDGQLTVDWEDDTTSTVHEDTVNRRAPSRESVNKNVVQVTPDEGKAASVEHYDDTGKRVVNSEHSSKRSQAKNIAAATLQAVQIAKDNNLAGYYNHEGEFVRIAGEEKPATTAVPPEAMAPGEAPAAAVPGAPPSATTTVPPQEGVTAEGHQELPAHLVAGFNQYAKRVGLDAKGQETKRQNARTVYGNLITQYSKLPQAEMEDRLEKAGYGKIIRDKMQYLRPDGVRIEMYSAGHPEMDESPMVMRTESDANGAQTLMVDPTMVMALADTARASSKLSGKKRADQFFNSLLREEEIHAADDIGIKQEYETLPAQAKANFEARGMKGRFIEPGWKVFKQDKIKQMIIEARDLRDSLPAADRKAMDDAFKASWNLYIVQSDDPLARDPRSFSGRDYFNELIDGNNKLKAGAVNFMQEFLRQLKQERLDGHLTEEGYATIWGKIQQWFRQALARIKAASVHAHQGAYGPGMRQALFDMERVVNDSEELLRQAKFDHIQTAKQGTKTYKEWAGNSITIDRKTGINKVLYHATGANFDEFKNFRDIGHHFGTLKAATDIYKGKTGFEGDSTGWNIMPVTIRIENPVRVDDLGGWSPEQFQNALEEGGYITDADLMDHIQKSGGSLTIDNNALVEILKNKGYDGIVYRNTAEGSRPMKPHEVEAKSLETVPMGFGDTRHQAIDPETGDYIAIGPTPEEADSRARAALLRMPQMLDDSYIVFSSNQVKSATGNPGAYSREDPSIIKAKAPDAPSLESQIVAAHNESGEGSSVSAAYGTLKGRDFYSVGVFPELTTIVQGTQITVQDILDFREKLMKEGLDPNQASKVIGTWVNPETGNSEIDFSANLTDLRAALVVAEENGQTAIYDHATGGVIFTNGAMGGMHPALGERAGFVAAKAATRKVELISDEAIMESGGRGEKFKDWYNQLVDFMYNDFLPGHRDYVPLVSDIFGATSANSSVAANVTFLKRGLRQFVETGKFHEYDYKDFHEKGPKKGQPKKFLGGHWDNLERIMRGELISGGKVDEFGAANLGDPYAMAVDIHVGRTMYGIPLKNTQEFPKAEDWSPNPNQRLDAQVAMARVADRMGWDWAELQAALFADHIQRTGEKVYRFEDFLTKYTNELRELVDADAQSGGAKGAGVGRGILERLSKRSGPERLLGLKAADEAAIRGRRAEALYGPYNKAARETLAGRTEGGLIVDPKIASSISLTGPKGPVPQKLKAKSPGSVVPPSGTGTTTTGTATTASDRRIRSAWNLGNLYDGAKQVFWNSVGLQFLGDRIHVHTDTRAKLRGEYMYPIHQWEKSVSSSEKKAAINENLDYWEKKAKGLPLPALSPAGKRLLNAVQGIIAKVNVTNASMGIKVQDPDTGNYVKLPIVDYPAQIRQEVLDAMRNKHTNIAEWNNLKSGLIADGILHKGATDIETQNHIDKVLRAYDRNGAFNRFFFHTKLMPKTSFDYSYDALHEFLQAWTERVSQVKAFGPDARNDIFTHAINNTNDLRSKQYIEGIQRLAYGNEITDIWGRFANATGLVASSVHLANWWSAANNIIYGTAFNIHALGPINFAKGFFSVGFSRTIDDAIERGIITRDISNVTAAAAVVGPQGQTGTAMQKLGAKIKADAAQVSDDLFKYSGFQKAEEWNRGIAMHGSHSILRTMIAKYNNKGMTGDVLRYMGYLERLGFTQGRAQQLLDEKGKGELTNEYLRAAVNSIHGGYSYADVPSYMETATGKFLFKYQKWGAEQAKYFATEVLKPALQGVRLAGADKVTVTDAAGNQQKVDVPRSVLKMLPLANYFLMLAGAAAGKEWLLEQLFGIHPKTMRLAEIMAQFAKSNTEGVMASMQKLWELNLQAGSMGSLGNYVQAGLVWAGQQDAKGGKASQGLAEGLPNLDPFLRFSAEIKKAWDQGAYTAKDFSDALNILSFARAGRQAVAGATSRINDVFGTEFRYEKTIANRQDISFVRNLQRRYQEDIGAEPKKGGYTPPPKDPRSVWRDPLDDALAAGDVDGAKAIIAQAKSTMPPAVWKEVELDSLKQHVRTQSPIKGSEAEKRGFTQWAKTNVDKYDQATLQRINDQYKYTAKRLGLGLEFKPPTEQEMHDYRRQINLKAQAAPKSAYESLMAMFQ